MTGHALGFRPNVGLIVADGAGRVLAGARAGRPVDDPSRWQLPQGGVDPGETPDQAAWRELAEETGLGPRSVRFERMAAAPVEYVVPEALRPPKWAGRWQGQALTWALFHFTGTGADIRLDAHEREFDDWAWTDLTDLAERVVDWKRPAYVAALAEFGARP